MNPILAAVIAAVAAVAAAVPVIWPLVRPWVVKLVDARFDFEFASRLETHKHDLELVTETARYDFQRKLANVSLHTARRHDAYAEAYRAARVAHGLILNQRGLRKAPTFEEYNREDVVAYLQVRNAPKGFIEDLGTLWDRDRDAAKQKLQPYARMLELQDAENAFANAKNELYLNELYFSDAVVEASNAFINAGAGALAELEYPSSTSAEWQTMRQALDAALERLHDAMRSELAAG